MTLRWLGKCGASPWVNDLLGLAATNLLSPVVLFFALGVGAAFARSDLTMPEALVKGMSLYLLMAIGFKGGVAARSAGFEGHFGPTLVSGLLLGLIVPVVAFLLLNRVLRVARATAAGTAAHYGSISIVTFVAVTDFLRAADLAPAGYMAAVAAAMETPGIIAALLLAGRPAPPPDLALATALPDALGRDVPTDALARTVARGPVLSGELIREVLLNGSVVVLVGAFAIGAVTGQAGLARLDVFVNALFQGVLCLFMLDMGLLAARRLMQGARLTASLVMFGLTMPLISAVLALGIARIAGIGAPEGAVLVTLAASASYIAAPAAIRMALPEADAGVYLPLALGVTFPFNLVVGIPLYTAAATAFLG